VNRLWAMSDRVKVPGWPGYVHKQANGLRLFILEKQITVVDPDTGEKVKHRFHTSTGAHDLEAALAQLKRFEANPFGYHRAGDADAVRAPLRLTTTLATQFYDYQVGRGLSPKYAREVNTWLAKWIVHLKGADLRRLDLSRDVVPLLDASAVGARRPLMASLKTICAWLRTERYALTSKEDATRDLRLPQADRAKTKKVVAHDIGDVRKVLPLLKGVYRDALLFQWATSCHVSELERFVRDERSRLVEYAKPQRLADGTKALAQVELWHKTKEWHRIALTRPEHVEAARRLRKRGSLPTRTDLNAVIYAACDKAEVPRMSYVMRHTTLTRAAAQGVSRERRMAHARHKNVDTAERYVDVQLPLAAVPAEKL
jgi:hypothetical protein